MLQDRIASGFEDGTMKTQKEIFQASEADRWFERNRASEAKSGSSNEVADLLRQIELRPRKVLEIGCSNGFRLNQIREAFDCECHGIDPSAEAIEDGRRKFPALSLATGTADALDFEDTAFDTIIFGFCLYLCDRRDLFKIAFEADRCLQDPGTLVVHDFLPPFPYRNSYSHCEGVFSYKMDYARMFAWNPAYVETAKLVTSHAGFSLRDVPNERVATVVLRKNEQAAYALDPFANKA
jgi:ubiquinone/menaquinone biosynthesis C-methylase UbiE